MRALMWVLPARVAVLAGSCRGRKVKRSCRDSASRFRVQIGNEETKKKMATTTYHWGLYQGGGGWGVLQP